MFFKQQDIETNKSTSRTTAIKSDPVNKFKDYMLFSDNEFRAQNSCRISRCPETFEAVGPIQQLTSRKKFLYTLMTCNNSDDQKQ